MHDHGIVTGTVEDFARALDVSPETVCEAMQDAGVTLMVDTARQSPYQ